MWFTAKKGSNQAKFRHLCAYEVLNVRNNSESSITFRHAGYDVLSPWYKYTDKIVLTNSSRYETADDGQTDAESNEITIAAGETGTIVSWYIPKFDIDDETPDAPIDNARLKTVVNGNAVTTTDVLKAYKNFACGNAYYMEVTWDGSNLYFSNEFCPDGNHPHMIDLGLPSGSKWATCNVGANAPEEYGDYFAWGETTPKSTFGAYNYKWYSGGDNHKITKYCSSSDYGTVDNRTVVEFEDDAAYVNWGPEWSMPYLGHFYELIRNCTNEWVKVNGMIGYVFKSKANGMAIFFPLAGCEPNGAGLETTGYYWTREYNYDYMNRPDCAYALVINYGYRGAFGAICPRHNGGSVRPVHYVPQE